MNIKDFGHAWDGRFIVITTKKDTFIGFAHADGRTLHIYKFDPMQNVHDEYDTCSALNCCLANNTDSLGVSTIHTCLKAAEQNGQLCICGKYLLQDTEATLKSMKQAMQQAVNNMKPVSATAVQNAHGTLPAIPGIAAKSFVPGNMNRYPAGTVFHCTKSSSPGLWTQGKDYTVEYDAGLKRNVVKGDNGLEFDQISTMEVQIAIIPGYGPNPYFNKGQSFVQQKGRAMRERAEGEFDVDVELQNICEENVKHYSTPKGYEPDEVRTDVDIMDLTRSIIGR